MATSLFIFPKSAIFTSSQIKTFIDICVGIGMLGLGSFIIPSLFGESNSLLMVAGLTISLGTWYTAIRLSRYIV